VQAPATRHDFGRDFFETSTMLITFILLGKAVQVEPMKPVLKAPGTRH
jgi:hypothetical protein